MHGGADGIGGQPGNRNALKHGRYTAEAIARRREVAALIRACRDRLGAMRDLQTVCSSCFSLRDDHHFSTGTAPFVQNFDHGIGGG
jgi:hypothetical protein